MLVDDRVASANLRRFSQADQTLPYTFIDSHAVELFLTNR
jgi:hypothetical protein